MTAIVALNPFLFDHDFGAEEPDDHGRRARDADAVRASEVEQALAEARAQGFAEGHRCGVIEANDAIDHHVAQAFDAMKEEFAALAAELRQQEEDYARNSAVLAAVICRKFLPSRYREAAADEIAELLKTLLPRVAEMPRVTVRVAENLVGPLAQRLSDLARTTGFPGLVETVGDTGIAAGDCRIEWLRGGVARDSALLWRHVDALFQEMLDTVPFFPPAPASRLDNPLERVSRDV